MQNINKFTNRNIEVSALDPLLKDVLMMFINENRASITMIQRYFDVGYARGARIMEQMEQCGFVSKLNNNCREVLISLEEYKLMFKDV